jgi:hypothetical protein
MPALDLKIGNQYVRLQKSVTAPHFGARTILVDDNWDFVELWLRRQKKTDALFFWRQARAFHLANSHLTKLSSPLTSYYCALNAAKALLTAKGVPYRAFHGLTGASIGDKSSLANEMIIIKGSGVLPELCRLLGESAGGERYNLKDIFYNLSYIHRAFCVTFKSHKELFIPISNARFVRKEKSSEAWFCATIADRKYQHSAILETLRGVERDLGSKENYVIRKKNRFRWVWGGGKAENIKALTAEHRKVREITSYIYGLSRLWYIKRTEKLPCLINRSNLTLTFMALHRISEIARYNPKSLEKHFNSQHNWLLSQFLERALMQFIDECSAEITGYDFMLPGYTSR